MKVYMRVTSDELELPVAVADSISGLAKMLNMKPDSLASIFSKVRKGSGRFKCYKIVEIEEEDEENERDFIQ